MAGFDPYATSVSDVYQDLHGHTSFTGKGIYDVHAFDTAVGDRFPDNAVLSHDLIEGEHVRTGFLTSAELVEDYPATYRLLQAQTSLGAGRLATGAVAYSPAARWNGSRKSAFAAFALEGFRQFAAQRF